MRFSEAIIHMDRGQRVTRGVWGPARWICCQRLMYFVRTRDGGLVPWEPRGTELFEDTHATDWVPIAAEDAAPVTVREEEPR